MSLSSGSLGSNSVHQVGFGLPLASCSSLSTELTLHPVFFFFSFLVIYKLCLLHLTLGRKLSHHVHLPFTCNNKCCPSAWPTRCWVSSSWTNEYFLEDNMPGRKPLKLNLEIFCFSFFSQHFVAKVIGDKLLAFLQLDSSLGNWKNGIYF